MCTFVGDCLVDFWLMFVRFGSMFCTWNVANIFNFVTANTLCENQNLKLSDETAVLAKFL